MKLLDLPAATGKLLRRARPLAVRLSVPALAAIAIATGTWFLYQSLSDYEDAHVSRAMDDEAAQLRSDALVLLASKVQTLERFAHRWERVPSPGHEEWVADADSLETQSHVFRAVEWRDPSLGVRWIAPTTANLPGLILDPNDDEARGREIALLADREDPAITRSIRVSDGSRQILVCAPMFVGDQRLGYMVGVIRLRDLLDEMVDRDLKLGYSITVYEGPLLVFGPAWEESWPESEWATDASLQMDELSLRFQVWPSKELEKELRSVGPVAALVGGLALAAAFGVLIYLLLRWRRRALAAEAGPTGPDEVLDSEEEADLMRLDDEGPPPAS